MKKTRAIFAVILSAILAFAFATLVACDKGTAEEVSETPDAGSGGGYTITLDAGAGTLAGSVTLTTNDNGKLAAMPGNPTPPSGFTFKEWNLKSDGSGSKVTTGTTFTKNTTIYAIYNNPDDQGATYNVTFHLNGGKIGASTTDPVIPTDNTGKLTSVPADPELAGSAFIGWTTTLNDKNTLVTVTTSYTVTSHTDLYAYYEATNRDIVLTGKSAAFKFDNATIVITLTARASWGDEGSEEVYIGGDWNSSTRFLLNCTTYTIPGNIPAILYVGFTEAGNGKYAAIPGSSFEDGKVHTVSAVNYDDASGWEGDNWKCTLSKTDIVYA